MKAITLLTALLLLPGQALSAAPQPAANQLFLMTENYPPFNFIDKGELKGISVELLLAMLQKTGSPQTAADIHLLPWARGYRNLQIQKQTVLFSTVKTPERTPLFKWVGPIAPDYASLIARKDRQIKVGDLGQARQYRIITVRDDIAEQHLQIQEFPQEHLKQIGTVDAISVGLGLLDRNRADLFAYGFPAAQWEMKKRGLDDLQYESVYDFAYGWLYYAFHIDTPDELINQLQNALDQLKADGTYQRIESRYLN